MADGLYFTLIHMVVVLARVTLINYSHHVFLNKEKKTKPFSHLVHLYELVALFLA